jgi:Protein of unknown function (DUF3618)
MGEDTRANGAAMTTEPRDPEQLRREIEQTREELGDTVAALAHKTDVKARVRQRLDHSKAPQRVRENPLPLAITGVFAVGFIAGRISSR